MSKIDADYALDAQLEASGVIEDTAQRMWEELFEIHRKTPWWKFISRWRRKWMARTAWAFWMAALDQKKRTEEIWDKNRSKSW